MAYANKTAIVKLPVDSNISCEESINQVKFELTKKGFFVPSRSGAGTGNPKVQIYKNRILSSYYGYPAARTETVSFLLGEAANLYSSPKFMATISAQIMAECSQVGIVEFGWFEATMPVGYFSDNTARVFTWVPPDNSGHSKIIQTANGEQALFQWGYYFSP